MRGVHFLAPETSRWRRSASIRTETGNADVEKALDVMSYEMSLRVELRYLESAACDAKSDNKVSRINSHKLYLQTDNYYPLRSTSLVKRYSSFGMLFSNLSTRL